MFADLIYEKLISLADGDYKQFNRKIIPTGYETLGVRMPALKKLAKEIAADSQAEEWLGTADFPTYEHILLYGLVLGQMKKMPIDEAFGYLDSLILKFDNWAHVDTIIPLPIFGRYPDEVLAHYLSFKTHDGEFAKRSFVILLMDMYMNEKYIDATLKHLAEVPQGQYYVDMAIAWALSLGLVKFYDRTLPMLQKPVFTKFVHNKAIRKARESYRIDPVTKEYLNSLKIK